MAAFVSASKVLQLIPSLTPRPGLSRLCILTTTRSSRHKLGRLFISVHLPLSAGDAAEGLSAATSLPRDTEVN